MNEYELLRAEILNAFDAVTQYNCVLYTVVAAILAFAIESDNFLLCLIPYLVILPIHFLCEDRYRNMCRISAYMYVFLESNDYHWEGRQYQHDQVTNYFDKKKVIPAWQTHLHYYFVPTACSAAAIYKVACSNDTVAEKCIISVITIVVTIIALLIIRKNSTDFARARKYYIDQWTAVRKAEEAEQVAASQPTQEANHGNESGG